MAYFYVKSSLGTRTTGGGLTKQTGSFTALGASSVYATIVAAITDGATHGDYILVSDAHSHNYGASSTVAGPTTDGKGLNIVSVSDTNCDQYSRGATEISGTTTAELRYDGYLNIAGLDLITWDQIKFNGEQDVVFYDCLLEKSSSGITTVGFLASNSANNVLFVSCTFNVAAASHEFIAVNNHVKWQFIDCDFTCDVTFTDELINSINGAAYTVLEFLGCRLDTLNSTYLYDGSNYASSVHDLVTIRFDKCKLPTTLTGYTNNLPAQRYTEFIVTSSSDSSGPQEYQTYYINGLGQAEENTAVYRDASQSFPSGTKVSIRVDTDVNASEARPFVFDMIPRYAELATASEDTLRIHILSSSTLSNDEVYVEVIYPDGTNKHTPNLAASISEYLIPGDFRVTAPAPLTPNTEPWTGWVSENRYQIDVDTSNAAGADCVPIIRVYVAKASTTIYFCSTVEVL